MTNSSAQDTYSITLDDSSTGVIAQEISTVLGDVITIDLSHINNSVTMASGTSYTSYDTITISDTVFTNNWIIDVPFENSFPNWDDFQKMSKEYPGLAQAYEKLKTFYVLCKDEWETKKKEQK